MCSLPAKIAIERKVDLPNDYLKDLIPVQLSSQPNSNQALTTVDGYPGAFGYLFTLTTLVKSERLAIISSKVTKLCEFLNSYVLNKKISGVGLDDTFQSNQVLLLVSILFQLIRTSLNHPQENLVILLW